MQFIKRLYSLYCLIVFLLLFILLMPAFFILLQKKSWRKRALFLNYYWAKLFFILCFVRVKTEMRADLVKSQHYIFCPNHFSFIDIAVMGLTPVPFVFVGKNSMESIPVFGYMYRKLHILVDRNNIRSKQRMMERSLEAIERKENLTIFPEGGIFAPNPPIMNNFKSGAFKMAIETGTPIIPVTIPFNWRFMPDDNKFLISHRSLRVIYHEPVETHNYSMETLHELRNKVFDIIAQELAYWNESDERNTSKDGTSGQARSETGE